MIIAFAWTTPALLAGVKTMTRRAWTPGHAARFRVWDTVDAYDRSPRAGGRPVATIRLTENPWRQRTGAMTARDREREGIDWLGRHGYRPPGGGFWHDWWTAWVVADEPVWVVEFDLAVVL